MTENRWSTNFPIGALAAATVAAVEPFKVIMRDLGATAAELALVQEARIRLAEDSIETAEVIEVGKVDLVSAGAITQAVAHALFRVPGLRAMLRVVEPDSFEITNLNRYLLAHLHQLEIAKAEIIAMNAPPGVTVQQVHRRATKLTIANLRPLADQVVVGTDDIPSRWLVQAEHPTWLAVGATAHFLAVSSEHEAGLACAHCMHPRDDEAVATIPTVSFVSYAAGLMTAARLLRRALGGVSPVGDQSTLLHMLQLNGRYAQERRRVIPARSCPLACVPTHG